MYSLTRVGEIRKGNGDDDDADTKKLRDGLSSMFFPQLARKSSD